jgi:hypothetical protein
MPIIGTMILILLSVMYFGAARRRRDPEQVVVIPELESKSEEQAPISKDEE